MYVIAKSSNVFVAKSGRKGSYTNSLEHARKFKTEEDAEKERCIENEYIIPLESLLDRQRG